MWLESVNSIMAKAAEPYGDDDDGGSFQPNNSQRRAFADIVKALNVHTSRL